MVCHFKNIPWFDLHSSPAISCLVIMAECKKSISCPSPASVMTSLARVLSHSRLSQPDQSVFKSHTSVYRSNVVQPGRRRRLSSSNSVESLDVSPCAEARVLVINTGGTIGMMYHNNGKAFLTGTFKVYLLLPKQSAFI